MKTCTNPKCNASGIPDDAMFCPICGEALVEATNPWKEKYNAFMKEREELLIKKKQLSLFETARQKMFSTLKQDGNYDAAMEENREIIKNNRNREGKTSPIFIVGLVLCGIGIVLLFIGLVSDSSPVMILGTLTAVVFLFMAMISSLASTEKTLVKNLYITNFLIPFIDGHRKDYSNAGVYNDSQNVLKSEITEPEEISKKISQKIEELTNRIEDIDHQMQLMQQMQQIE